MHYFKAFLKFKKTQQKPNQQTHKQQKKTCKALFTKHCAGDLSL